MASSAFSGYIGVPSVYDGWHDDGGETWTYASATTFTVVGDQTAKYQVGTKLKLTQTTVKYFYVAAVAVAGGTTTVTVTGGSDYSLANAAISANNHSYADRPQGFPDWFNWAPTVGGFSGSPTVQARFRVSGRTCTMAIFIDGTSNAGSLTFTAPITYSSIGMTAMLFWARVKDSGTAANGTLEIDTANPTTVQVYKDAAGNVFTGTGAKQLEATVTYEI